MIRTSIALAICPVKGEVHRAFQFDLIKREEVDQRIADVLAEMNSRGVIISRPQIIRSGQEMGLTIAAPVMNGEEIVAAVVAVVSFQEVFKALQQSPKSTREMLDAGTAGGIRRRSKRQGGGTSDAAIAFSERPMTDRK
jgi:hypothetical protein